jgi:stage IV sporulation protein FB
MVEFSLFKIPIRVEPIFWITLGLLGFLGNMNSDMPGDVMIMDILLFVMAGFISILIHELGHALMIKKYKLPTEIVLSSFGGYATYPIGILTRLQSFLVTLAGPLIQFVFGIAMFFIIEFSNLPDSMIQTFFSYLIWVSLIWSVLNCVPVIPLDGGRMMEAILGPRRIKTTLLISMLVAIAACVYGFSSGQTFLGIFMAMFAFQNFQAWEQFK